MTFNIKDGVLVVAEGVKVLRAEDLQGLEFNSVVLPEGLEVIGEGTFKGRMKLREVSLPNSLIEIGAQAFRGCGIEEIIIPASVLRMGEGVFMHCMLLKRVLCRAEKCPMGWYSKSDDWQVAPGRVTNHQVYDWLEGASGYSSHDDSDPYSDCRMGHVESNVQVIWNYNE